MTCMCVCVCVTTQGADVTKGGSPSWLPIAIILPVIGALLLVATGVMYEVSTS